MQKFTIPARHKPLEEYITTILLNNDDAPKLDGAKSNCTPYSFIDLIETFREPHRLLPVKDFVIPSKMETRLQEAGTQLFNDFRLQDDVADNVLAHLRDSLPLQIVPKELAQRIANLRAATQNLEVFEEFLRYLHAHAVKLRDRTQEKRGDPGAESKLRDDMIAASAEFTNEQVMRHNREHPDNPMNAAEKRHQRRENLPDLENTAAALGGMVRDYEDIIAQTGNAKALMAGIAENAEAICQKRARKPNPPGSPPGPGGGR